MTQIIGFLYLLVSVLIASVLVFFAAKTIGKKLSLIVAFALGTFLYFLIGLGIQLYGLAINPEISKFSFEFLLWWPGLFLLVLGFGH